MALGQAGRAAIQRGIHGREPFTHGNVSGSDAHFQEAGILPEPWLTRYRQEVKAGAVRYVVRSYDTPIAWRTPSGWVIPAVKYSKSTGNHQAVVTGAVKFVEFERIVAS